MTFINNPVEIFWVDSFVGTVKTIKNQTSTLCLGDNDDINGVFLTQSAPTSRI